ncbi:MAG TPA: Nramp family divalent metal transporter, partial [Planctomycetota bacterium]|nr:Nramp family divalent metal transporter [Planctomycetota bacterium]
MAAARGIERDPYQLRPEDVEPPPASFAHALSRLGPGMVLAAAIVGSGELIATTTLGAQVGYAALWIILLSCAVKPVVQAELGRYTIASGETGLEGLNRVPGPRLGVSWLLWAWALMVLVSLVQVGGMFGGVGQILNLLMPAVPVWLWVIVLLGLTQLLLLGGTYERIERFALVKVGFFTLLTVLAAVVLTRMPEVFSWERALSGLRPQLPGSGLVTAVAVFGITGVGGTELFMYPYWCVEKG